MKKKKTCNTAELNLDINSWFQSKIVMHICCFQFLQYKDFPTSFHGKLNIFEFHTFYFKNVFEDITLCSTTL